MTAKIITSAFSTQHNIPGPSELVISVLERYLGAAKRGEITGLFIVMLNPVDSQICDWALDRNATIQKILGAVEISKMDFMRAILMDATIIEPQDDGPEKGPAA